MKPISRLVSLLAGGLAVATLLALFASPALAGGDDFEREIKAAQERYHALMREAKELEAGGRMDKAHALRKEAQALGEKIERALHERERGHKDRDVERKRAETKAHDAELKEQKEILGGLERGIEALKRLGRHEEAKHLARIAEEVRGAMKHAKDPRPKADGPGEEDRRFLEGRIEALKRAMAAFGEAGKEDAAHRMEQAVHALKTLLAGRQDEEAHMIRERAPRGEELADLVALAAELFQDWGHERDARMLADLARGLLHEQKGAPKQPKPGLDHLREMERRMQELQHAIRELAGQMERIRREMEGDGPR